MASGESSALRTVERDVRAEFIRASGAWKAGEREVMMEGVRRRIEGLGPSAESNGCGVEPGLECRCGWVRGRVWRRGRNAWRVRTGVRRRVLRRSEMVEAGRAAMGSEGYVEDGMRIKERKARWWCFAP